MKASKCENLSDAGNITLEMESDVIRLGEYLAGKHGISLGEFVEYLITKEAAKGKVTSPPWATASIPDGRFTS